MAGRVAGQAQQVARHGFGHLDAVHPGREDAARVARAFAGGVQAAGRKSSTTKVLMVMAVEIVEPKGFGRIRLRRIDRDAATHVSARRVVPRWHAASAFCYG